jgi:hypothetical protein
MEYIDQVTDSIWYARGNEMPFDFFDEVQQEEEVLNEQEYDTQSGLFPEATENPLIKNYYELRDSVQVILQQAELERVIAQIFVQGNNLCSQDARFTAQLAHNAEGVFYLDNARNLDKSQGLWYFQTVLPTLYKDIQELYAGNVILGDLFLKDNSVEFAVEAQYGPALGSIYSEMNDAKFDKNVLKYIPASSSAYFTYNINMQKAYEQAYKVLLPLLSDEKNAQIKLFNVVRVSGTDEIIRKILPDKVRGEFRGSLSIIDLALPKTLRTYELSAEADENR